MPFDKDTAATAGRKGGAMKGISKKEAWLRLGYKLTGKHTANIDRYMNDLWRAGERDKYVKIYLDLLPYLKPKLQAHAIRQQTEVSIKLIHPDEKLLDDI